MTIKDIWDLEGAASRALGHWDELGQNCQGNCRCACQGAAIWAAIDWLLELPLAWDQSKQCLLAPHGNHSIFVLSSSSCPHIPISVGASESVLRLDLLYRRYVHGGNIVCRRAVERPGNIR